MTDKELRDLAVQHLKKTTISYPEWEKRKAQGKYPDVTQTEWWKSFDYLGKIGVPPPTTPPTTPPTGSVLELNGTYDNNQLNSMITSTIKTVRPKPGGTVLVEFKHAVNRGLDGGVSYENIVFDGTKYVEGIWMPDMKNWKFINCTFRNFFRENDPNSHSEAMYIGGGCENGLIDGCHFDNNGTTSHIFFTFFGGSPDPKNICIKNTKFTRCHNQWYSIQMRDELSDNNNINIDPSCTHDGPGFQKWVRPC